MYRERPNLTIGFHGCDLSVRDNLVQNPNQVKKSQEKFDWLGHGFYIWENNYERALKWAKEKKERGSLTNPSVVGVVYHLNYCLDFTDSEFIQLLPSYYDLMVQDLKLTNREVPQNKNQPQDKYHDLIFRELDCAVIQYLHQKIEYQIKDDLKKK